MTILLYLYTHDTELFVSLKEISRVEKWPRKSSPLQTFLYIMLFLEKKFNYQLQYCFFAICIGTRIYIPTNSSYQHFGKELLIFVKEKNWVIISIHNLENSFSDERRWAILSSQEPTEVQLSKLKLKLYWKNQKCILVIALNPKFYICIF